MFYLYLFSVSNEILPSEDTKGLKNPGKAFNGFKITVWIQNQKLSKHQELTMRTFWREKSFSCQICLFLSDKSLWFKRQTVIQLIKFHCHFCENVMGLTDPEQFRMDHDLKIGSLKTMVNAIKK